MQSIPSEFLAIDRRARANMPLFDLDQRAPEERICDFQAVVIEFSPERAMVEAARCIHCPNPALCMTACPTHNDIPSAMWLMEHGRFSEAADLYHQTSSLGRPGRSGRAVASRHARARARRGRRLGRAAADPGPVGATALSAVSTLAVSIVRARASGKAEARGRRERATLGVAVDTRGYWVGMRGSF